MTLRLAGADLKVLSRASGLGRISNFEEGNSREELIEAGHEQLLSEIGSSIRQQFRDVRPSGGRLAGASDGGFIPKCPGLRPEPRPFGGGNSAPDPRIGAPTSGGSRPEESRPMPAGLSGLRSPTEP